MPACTGHIASSPSARATVASVAFAAALALAFVAACTKSESGTPAPETSSAPAASAVPVVETPSPSATASESAAPPADTGHAAAVAKDAADAGHAAAEPPKIRAAGGGAAAAPSASGSASPVECGTKPHPACPLQAWMKAHANPPVLTSDLPALAKALDEIALFAPAGYTNWASISKDGAAAARAGDLTAAKASCRSCHDQYKQKYKTEIRARKI